MNLFAFKNNNLKANEVSSQAFSQYNDVLTERYNQILKLLEDEKISPEFAKLLTNYIR